MQHITGGATSSAQTGEGTASSAQTGKGTGHAEGGKSQGGLVTGGRWNNPCFLWKARFPHRNHLSGFDTREQTTFPGASSITKGRRLEVTLLNQLVVTTNVTTRTGR